jgi:SAM-dependent methyltransferase
MVERARRTAVEAGLAKARFETGDALALPFPDGRFDIAISRLAIHHIPDAGAALCEMARVIRSGGRIGLFDMTTSEDVAEAAYHNEVERLRDPSHASALPLSELFRLIGRAGLDADRLDTMDYEFEVEDWTSGSPRRSGRGGSEGSACDATPMGNCGSRCDGRSSRRGSRESEPTPRERCGLARDLPGASGSRNVIVGSQ